MRCAAYIMSTLALEVGRGFRILRSLFSVGRAAGEVIAKETGQLGTGKISSGREVIIVGNHDLRP